VICKLYFLTVVLPMYLFLIQFFFTVHVLSCTTYFIYYLFYPSNTTRECCHEGQIKVFWFDLN